MTRSRQLQRTLALLCGLALSPGAQAASKPIAQRATEISMGNRVELRMKTDRWTPVKGRLLAVNGEGITIQTKEKGSMIEKPIAFSEIRSLSDRGNQKLATRVFAQIGVMGAGIVGLLVYVSSQTN